LGLNPDFADRNIQVPRTFSVPLDSNTPSRFVSGTYTAAAEVLLDIGMLDFGKGVTAKANVAVCWTRGDEKQLVGEFAYQCKFKRRDERTPSCGDEALRAILLLPQLAAQDWVSLSTTKTGAVYRLKGNPPQAHE
jgi:hypothetical protein